MTYDLKSFAFSQSDLNSVLLYKIYDEIQNSRYYFYRHCGSCADEAMQLTIFHALGHYREENGDLGAYVRSLARTILRDRYANIVCPVDFLEETVRLDGVSGDIARQVVDEISEEGCYDKVVSLALTCMNSFILMCSALESKDTSTLYFPDHFTSECLKLQQEYSSFFQVCNLVYTSYKKDFLDFIVEDKSKNWVEANFTLIESRKATRVSFISNKTGKISKDPDTEDCLVRGSIGTKRIISVPYAKQLSSMCNLIDEEGINKMRFTIGDEYILRTLGGSISVLSPSLFNEYDLCESEILTNLLKDTNGRFICKGSKCMYFLVPTIPEIQTRVVRGIYLPFDVNVEV